MADEYTVIPVQNLQLAETMTVYDTLIAEQGGYARRLPASLFKGEKGDPGADGTMTFEDLTDEQKAQLKGDTGPQGPAGGSPTVTAEQISNGVSITVTDADGTVHPAVILANGSPGSMPSIAVGTVTTLDAGRPATVEILAGTTTDYVINFGVPKGDPGFSFDDFTAEELESLRGPAGPAGPGVASGGTAGQVLVKNSATNYDTKWANLPDGSLPAVSASDNGKVLAVVNGQWAAVDIRTLLGQYVFDYDSATNTLDITTEVS